MRCGYVHPLMQHADLIYKEFSGGGVLFPQNFAHIHDASKFVSYSSATSTPIFAQRSSEPAREALQ